MSANPSRLAAAVDEAVRIYAQEPVTVHLLNVQPLAERPCGDVLRCRRTGRLALERRCGGAGGGAGVARTSTTCRAPATCGSAAAPRRSPPPRANSAATGSCWAARAQAVWPAWSSAHWPSKFAICSAAPAAVKSSAPEATRRHWPSTSGVASAPFDDHRHQLQGTAQTLRHIGGLVAIGIGSGLQAMQVGIAAHRQG